MTIHPRLGKITTGIVGVALAAVVAVIAITATGTDRPGGAIEQASSGTGAASSDGADVNREAYLVPDDKGVPPSSASEPSGNFRFLCSFSHLAPDDPIVHPGEPGSSHLHMFFGNTKADAFSTYESLRRSGDGTCQGGPLNRSAYWAPAMLDGKGKVVIADYISVYYKGNGPSADQIAGIRQFPDGLKMIAGYDMAAKVHDGDTHFSWACESGGDSVSQTIPSCPEGERVGARLAFPTCWDGVHLDSADHRSHMAYGGYDPDTGKWSCPADHSVLLPEYTIGVWFTQHGDTAGWHLSSDRMAGMDQPGGTTFHADWFGAWDPATMRTWVTKCIDGMLNCVGGELGDGTSLAATPEYTGSKLLDPPTG